MRGALGEEMHWQWRPFLLAEHTDETAGGEIVGRLALVVDLVVGVIGGRS